MTSYFIKSDGIISLGSISNEDDLKPKPGINLNPPPSDGRCDCCGRHLSELKPFGKAGDPLVGDFDGELLVKTFRLEFPPDKELESLWDVHFGDCKTEENLNAAKDIFIQKYGPEKYSQLYYYIEVSGLSGQVRKAWLCRDCILLDDDEYFAKLSEVSSNRSEQEQVVKHEDMCGDKLEQLDDFL